MSRTTPRTFALLACLASLALATPPLPAVASAAAALGGPGSNFCGPAVTNSAGTSAEIQAVGSDVVADNDFALAATGMPNFKLGFFLMSTTPAFVPMAGGSQGNLCLGGSITRLSQAVLNTGFSGSFAMALDLNALPAPAFLVLPGETWRFQAWYRDLNPANTSNFSDGLAVAFQ